MSIQVIRPGLLTSIQDLGRYGMQKHGVVVSGAMDSFALRAANILVGNEEGDPALEITIVGPKLQFMENSLIAICGGNLSPAVDGQYVPLWRQVFVKKGSCLSFGAVKTGCRAYLAVAGGFDVPEVMNSRSTYLRLGIGGFHGRPLRGGDVLKIQAPSYLAKEIFQRLYDKADSKSIVLSNWSVSSHILPDYQKNPMIRVIQGGQYHWFTAKSREQFFKKEFVVTPQSDRMGYRLSGQKLTLSGKQELISEAVTAGTVQVPPDGNPIILLADRQTTGGYPKIAQAATADLPVLAQVMPGAKIHFREIDLDEAQRLVRLREMELQQLKQGVKLKV